MEVSSRCGDYSEKRDQSAVAHCSGSSESRWSVDLVLCVEWGLLYNRDSVNTEDPHAGPGGGGVWPPPGQRCRPGLMSEPQVSPGGQPPAAELETAAQPVGAGTDRCSLQRTEVSK
ncbi:hypothetical protein KUDE01_003809 [Dissostichus eleginoides]|uniref:Uncharacterized protein n=1 Tax=Dissostichus eleginoides TaxID=100907 RepID=A0AAD9CED5_DISEL|nr:hypothetical protein KUDE01_003809 [Dissostichus eleginoides]